MTKIVNVVTRLHEQREHPEKYLRLVLKKGIIVEELTWDRKTEKTVIFKRLILKNFKWTSNGKKRHLVITFQKQNIGKEGAKKRKLIKQIIDEQYPVLALSFFDHLISSTVQKLNDYPPKQAEKLAKLFAKEIVRSSKENKLIEKEGV